MPNLETHADNAAPIIIGVTTIIYSVYTAEFIVIFLSAVLGAGIGLAFRPAVEPAKSKVGTVLMFAGHAGWILITAIITTAGSYYFHRFIDGSVYPVAIFFSMGFMVYREKLIAVGESILSRKGDTL